MNFIKSAIMGSIIASSFFSPNMDTKSIKNFTDYSIHDGKILNLNNSELNQLEINKEYKLNFNISNKPLSPFVSTVGGSKSDVLYGMVPSKDGGYVIAGHTDSNDKDVKGLFNGGTTDALIAKLDNFGDLVWIKTFGGSLGDVFTKVVKSNDGNGYVASGYSDSKDKDLQGLDSGSYGTGGLLVKYDEEGNRVFAKRYLANDKNNQALQLYSVKPLKEGGYILAGVEGRGAPWVLTDPYDAVLIKVDENGNEKWRRTYGGSYNDMFEMAIESEDGNILAIGRAYSTNGDITSSMAKGHNDAQIIKYNKDGDIIWKKSFGGSGDDSFRDIVPTKDGGSIVVGYTESNNIDLSGIKQNGTARDALIVKFDSQGNVIWKKTLGGSKLEYLLGIEEDSQGNFLTTGFGASNDGDFLNMNNGEEDAIVIKFQDNKSDVNIIWKRTFGGSKAERLRAIVALPDGGYAIAGNTFSNDKGLQDKLKGSDDGMIVKFDNDGGVDFANYDESISRIKYSIDAIYDSGKGNIQNGEIINEQLQINAVKNKEILFKVPRKLGIKEIELSATILDDEDYDISNNQLRIKIPVKHIESIGPELKLSLSSTEITNKSVEISAVAFDEDGVDFIVTPDGSKVFSDNTKYSVNENGMYGFVACNINEECTLKAIDVSNIDKTNPTISISKNPDKEWTNQEVFVDVSAKD